MNPEIIHVLPDTAISVLEMFTPSKEGCANFAAKVINDVEDGKINPLKVKLLCKTMEEIAEKVNEGTKEHQKTEAAKYGDKPFPFFGSEMHYTTTKTEYDFTMCNDPELSDMQKELKSLQERIKARQEFLKKIQGEEVVVIHGEATKLYAPMKRQWHGVKTTLK
jgi:hypothetical protein